MKIKLAIATCLALAMILVLPLACAKKAVPQAQEEPKGKIVVGFLDDLSGISAGHTTAHVEGEKDAIRYINEELGGIDGHVLDYIVIDHKLDATLMLSGWDRLKEEGVPLVSSYAGTFPVLENSCQEDRITLLGTFCSIDQGYPKGLSYFFASSPHLPGSVPSLFKQIEQDWAKKGKKGTPKIGFDVINMGVSKIILEKAVRMEVEKRGWDNTFTYTAIAPAEVTTQVLQMKNFGVDYLYMLTNSTAVITWFKELERQNFWPEIYGSPNSGAPIVKEGSGELVVGTHAYQQGPQWTDMNVPYLDKLHELNAKWHPDVTWRSSYYTKGFATMIAAAEALKKALENTGYQNLNTEAVRMSMETIRDFDPMGYGSSFTWTPTDHHGLHAIRWYTWTKELIMVPKSDWMIQEPLPEEQRTNDWWYKD